MSHSRVVVLKSLPLLGALLFATPSQASDWIAAWTWAPSSSAGSVAATSTTPPNPNDPRGPLGPSTVMDATLIQTVRVTAAGRRVRIRVVNTYRETDLHLGRVSVALADGSPLPLLFDGSADVVLPVGASRLSDPVDLQVQALDRLVVRLFLPDQTALPDHRYRQTLISGDATAVAGLPDEADKVRMGGLISAVQVETDEPPGVIVALGDSITEGTGALPSPQGVRGWPERLAERMVAAHRPWAVVNAGIGGNRLLRQGSGPSGLERLDMDALAVPGARCLILLEGINDLGRPARTEYAGQDITAADLIAGYRQVIARAHGRGFRVVIATLPPYAGANYFSETGEAIRQAANAWIRTSGEPDAVVDFEAAVRDPAQPDRLLAQYQSGDHLHPSDAGYAAMAEAIPMDVCN